MLQVADIALVKYLLQHSRTLEVHHKDPSGLTFLECLTKNLAKFPFLAYSACMDELLGRRVPVTLTALVDIWSHISTWSTRMRWTIDEEFTPANENGSSSPTGILSGSPRGVPLQMPGHMGRVSAVDMETLNRAIAPGSSVKAAAVPTSLMAISTGSNMRSSAGASRLAPVSEDEDEESPTYLEAKMSRGGPAMLEEDSVIEEGEEHEIDSGSDFEGPLQADGHEPAALRESSARDRDVNPRLLTAPDASSSMLGLIAGGADVDALGGVSQGNVDEGNITITANDHGTDGQGKNLTSSFDALPSVEVRSWQPRQRVPVSSGLSKSLGAAAVSKVLASKSWSVGGSSVVGIEATSMATDEVDLGDEVDVENLMTTPSGLKSLRWSLALGEQLAHGSFPFMRRQLHIESLQAALRVSSMALVQWRTQAQSAEARLLDGGTALHAAVKHEVRNALIVSICKADFEVNDSVCTIDHPRNIQMWAAAVEVLDRGVDIFAADNNGNTAFDVLVERVKGTEAARSPMHELETPAAKVAFVRQSRLYHETPVKRRMLLDRLLSVLVMGL